MSLSSDRSNLNLQGGTMQLGPHAKAPGLGGERQEESLRDMIRVLKRRRFLILYFAMGMLGLAILVCLVMKNEWTSTATLLVDESNASGLDLGDLSSLVSSMGVDDVKMELDTDNGILTSDTTALMVVNQLGLDKIDPYRYDPHKIHLNPYDWNPALKREIGKPLDKAPATRERIMRIISHRLKVETSEGTRLLTVEYRDYDSQRAADVANAFVNLFIRKYLEDHFQATARASDWLTAQLGELKNKVDDSQKKLADYESKTGMSLLMLGMAQTSGVGSSGSAGGVSMMGSGGVHLPAVDRLAQLNAELTSAEADTIAKDAIYHLTLSESPEVVLGLGASSLASIGSPSSVTSGGGLELLQNLRQQQSAVQQAYGDAVTKYGSKNPHLAELKGQLAGINQSIQDELGRIRERAKNDVDLANKAEDSIRTAYKAQESEVNKLNDSTIQLEVLADEALTNRELYEELNAKLQEANIEAGVKATNLDLVDMARPTSLTSRPNWIFYPPIGLALGLIFGIAAAFVRENLDDSIVTPDEVERISWLPVLSYLPLYQSLGATVKGKLLPKGDAGGEKGERSPLILRPVSPESEAYRSLRTSIQLSEVDDPLRAFLVTSPLSGDGKTTISYNIAISFALHERRVLLVDADMRKPQQHVVFGARKSPGLSEVLTGGVHLKDAVVQHHAIPSLHLLSAGATPPNPSELINSRRFEALIEEAKGQFDYVIIDSPPVLMVTDAVILSTKVDGTIMVVRSRKTTRLVLKRATEALSQSRGRKLGYVVNGVDTKSVEYYYAYGYYGDNKYYGEEA